MTDLNKQELRGLAEAAGPGPWFVSDGMGEVRDRNDRFVCESCEKEPRNSAFIAAANPATILSLLDECDENDGVIAVWRGRTQRAEEERDQLRAEVEALRKDAERYRRYRLGFVRTASLDESIDKAIATCGGLGCCQFCADEAGEVGNGQG